MSLLGLQWLLSPLINDSNVFSMPPFHAAHPAVDAAQVCLLNPVAESLSELCDTCPFKLA